MARGGGATRLLHAWRHLYYFGHDLLSRFSNMAAISCCLPFWYGRKRFAYAADISARQWGRTARGRRRRAKTWLKTFAVLAGTLFRLFISSLLAPSATLPAHACCSLIVTLFIRAYIHADISAVRGRFRSLAVQLEQQAKR